jgi:hypothetical protein
MLSFKKAARAGELNIGQIDTAELLRQRAYALGTGDGYAPGVSVKQDAAGSERAEMALLQAQIDTQRQTIELLRNELSDVKKNGTPGAVALTSCASGFLLTSQTARAQDRLRHLSSNVECISRSIELKLWRCPDRRI